MARVKRDKTSWRAAGIWLRDFKSHPEETKHSSRKNTRRWCRGKDGAEHDYNKHKELWLHFNDHKMFRYIWKCTKCGKELYFRKRKNQKKSSTAPPITGRD